MLPNKTIQPFFKQGATEANILDLALRLLMNRVCFQTNNMNPKFLSILSEISPILVRNFLSENCCPNLSSRKLFVLSVDASCTAASKNRFRPG